jgi:hypothetical protein
MLKDGILQRGSLHNGTALQNCMSRGGHRYLKFN